MRNKFIVVVVAATGDGDVVERYNVNLFSGKRQKLGEQLVGCEMI